MDVPERSLQAGMGEQEAGRFDRGVRGVDYAAVFAINPTPLLLLDLDLVIVDANDAYLAVTHREKAGIVGRGLFEAFPADLLKAGVTAVDAIRASLERVIETEQPDTMAVQRHDITIKAGGGFEKRFWSPTSVPVFDGAGELVLVLHRVENVTAFVQQSRRHGAGNQRIGRRRSDRLAEEEIVARSHELALANQTLREAGLRDHGIALALQAAMLPPPVRPAGFELATRYRPAEDALTLGGDWYDVIELEEGRSTFTVGDVIGKGLPAAAVMGQLRSALASATYTTDGPPEALELLDHYAAVTPGALGASVVQVLIDSAAGQLRYSRAGHPPPILLLPTGQTVVLDQGTSPPLGAMPENARRAHQSCPAPSGCTVVLYTDGLIERRDKPLSAGIARLTQILTERAADPVEELADRILTTMLTENQPADDIALLLARTRPESLTPPG